MSGGDQTLSAVKSADRVLDVFEALGDWDTGMTHSRLAQKLGIPKSSLSQLLQTLMRRRYIRYEAVDKTYHIGPRIEALAEHKRDIFDLTKLVQPYLERLTIDTGESTFLNLLSGDMAQLTARVIGPQPLVTVLNLGQMVPLYATAGSRAILAFLPQEMQEDYLQRTEFRTFMPNTLTSADKIREVLTEVRNTKISVSCDELFDGISGIATPVLTATGHVLGAVVVSLPSIRFDEQSKATIVAALREKVDALESQIARTKPRRESESDTIRWHQGD